MKRLLPILLLWCVVARGANTSFNDFDTNQFHANAFGPQPRVTLFSLSPTNLDLVIGINMTGVTNGHQLVISATGGQGQATNSIDIGALTNIVILTNGIERLIAATTDTNVVNILLLFPHMSGLVVTNGVTNLLLQASGADVVWADANGMLTNVPGQAANVFYSGPPNSGPAQPTFRAIVQKDLLGANVAFQDRVNTFSKDNYFAGLQSTNGITNLSLTASTVLKSDSAKAISSIPNGTGALTNNGAGVVDWYNGFIDIVSARALTNSFDTIADVNAKTNLLMTITGAQALTNNFATIPFAESLTNSFDTIADVNAKTNLLMTIVGAQALTNNFATIPFAESLTNGKLGSASGVGTNITLKGTTHFDSLQSTNNFNIQSLNAGTVERFMSGGGVDLTFNDVGAFPWLSTTTPLAIPWLTNSGGATFANGLTTIDGASGLIATPEIDATTAFIQDLWITNLSGTIPAVNLQPSAIVLAGLNTSVSSTTNSGVISYTVNATGGSGTDLAINYAVGVSNLTVESPIFTNSHALFSTNNLMLETTIDVHGTTNFLQQHWDTFFRKGLFGYSNNISSNASGLWMGARWATNAVAGQVVLYVKGGLTNEDAALIVKASEIWSTNGVAAAGGGGQTPALVSQTNQFVNPGPAIFNTYQAQTAGNFSVVTARIGITSGTATCSNSLGDNFTLVGSVTLPGDGDKVWMWYATNIAPGVATITVDPHSGAPTVYVGQAEFSGVALYQPVDQMASQLVASSTTADSGATAATANVIDLVIGGVGTVGANSSFTAGAGFTLLSGTVSSTSEAMEYKVTNATGAQQATFTLGSALESGTICVAFKNHP